MNEVLYVGFDMIVCCPPLGRVFIKTGRDELDLWTRLVFREFHWSKLMEYLCICSRINLKEISFLCFSWNQILEDCKRFLPHLWRVFAHHKELAHLKIYTPHVVPCSSKSDAQYSYDMRVHK